MNSARIRDATVAWRYHVTSLDARSATNAQAQAPRMTADTGTATPRGGAVDARIAIGASQSAAAATCREDQPRGSRQRESAVVHASAPPQSTAAWPSSTPDNVAMRAAVQGWREKCRKSTAAG